jgi:hypothetical protein
VVELGRKTPMKTKSLLDFLNNLEEKNIYYRLNKIRNSILVEVAVPGERWEVEFMEEGNIEIEKFISDKNYYDETEIKRLFEEFSD